MSEQRTVTVCANCLCASCWQGEYYCDEYKTADVVEKTIAELTELNKEHPSWWSEERITSLMNH